MLIAITVTSSSFLIIIASFIIAFSVMFVKANVANDSLYDAITPEFDSI